MERVNGASNYESPPTISMREEALAGSREISDLNA
jgi:hypothetical protein